VRRRRSLSNTLLVTVIAALAVGLLGPGAIAHAQNEIVLTLNVPTLWEDTLTPELLAEFEAQHPGVKVYVTFSETVFFGFGGGSSTVDERLDSTEEFVTSADVLYVDPSSLTTEDTQAGYFLDLAPLVMNDTALDTADFIPAVWQSYQWDNGIWALPLSTDLILVNYNQTAFDEAGLAYPNEHWTVDDFANAARLLTQYNADGSVAIPGMTASLGANNLNVLLRSLLSAGLYDTTTMPNAPLFTDPALETILQTWYELQQEGVVASGGGGFAEDIPLQIGGVGQRGPGNNDDSVTYASLLPGGVAGLNVQGFAVSAGTQNPELAYELAKFLTSRPELARNFFSIAPARYSLVSSTPTNENPGNGPGGGRPFGGNRTVPEEIQPVVDQGLIAGLPVSELRYTSYLSTALSEISANGGDVRSALQTAEALAISDIQTAQARYGTVSLSVAPPTPDPMLAPGEIALNCAVNLGFGGRGLGSQLPNQDQWDQVVADFVAADPEVGIVNLESVQTTDLAVLAPEYDCIILPANVVPESDLSAIINLDPLMDTDTSFDRNDIIGNTLIQLQQDNKTWALPLAIEPQMLQYNAERFALAGVAEPINGWTVDTFVDALHMLKPYDTDPSPFVANDPGATHFLMLIAAFGGLPMDYRTNPPTINFTDPTTVEAIRQVLDLIVDGYIAYNTDTFNNPAESMDTAAITTNSLNQFRGFRPPPDQENQAQDTWTTTTYPQGSQYNVVAYNITTGYISASAENREAAYRFLSEVARNPHLFSGMPVRQSLVNDPTVVASQGTEIAAVYQQIDALLRDPNTIVFPTLTSEGGINATNFIQEYWLRRACERYMFEGADLETELAEAQLFTTAYLDCAEGIVVDITSLDAFEQQREAFEQIRACATSVDPSFELMD